MKERLYLNFKIFDYNGRVSSMMLIKREKIVKSLSKNGKSDMEIFFEMML
jgi:DNA-binding CsgD family transcriptional regulator